MPDQKEPPAQGEDIFAVTTTWGIKSHSTDLSNVMHESECLFIGNAYECACFIRDNKTTIPPARPLWEEVDAVKEKPGVDGIYGAIDKDGEIHSMRWINSHKEWAWLSGSVSGSNFIKSYLRPVTRTTVQGEGFSEEDIVEAIRYGVQTAKELLSIEQRAKRFIKSLNKK